MFRETVQDVFSYLSEVNEFIQSIGIFLLSLIPFVESPGGTAIGALIGLPIIFALAISIIGNWLSLMAIILPFNAWLVKFRNAKQKGFIHKRASKARERYEKYGVPGVALLAPLVASGHIAAFASLAAGASKRTVVFWHVVSIVVWGVIGAGLGLYLKSDVIS
ncbi:small multi-drug export protein [Aquisalibacillus elongatus]|uniref:Putative small multi-drug export protein n=1 Tax=Aquisalibacillus elongatus TaxID=485577 RepID=A0A3N5BUM5_9BACI|nr:small multi-drug export protein [Aquisalibacillus elongatus]RPF53468.1 putative small multi-drug export protein [Aquisalibacillus elongatus]